MEVVATVGEGGGVGVCVNLSVGRCEIGGGGAHLSWEIRDKIIEPSSSSL